MPCLLASSSFCLLSDRKHGTREEWKHMTYPGNQMKLKVAVGKETPTDTVFLAGLWAVCRAGLRSRYPPTNHSRHAVSNYTSFLTLVHWLCAVFLYFHFLCTLVNGGLTCTRGCHYSHWLSSASYGGSITVGGPSRYLWFVSMPYLYLTDVPFSQTVQGQ